MGVYQGQMTCPKCGKAGIGQVNTGCGTNVFWCENEACQFFYEEWDANTVKSSDPEYEGGQACIEFSRKIVDDVMPPNTPNWF